ncbi:hypothetical protein AC579_1708 [Pseudocercospora musae]|uniref:SnoaL-like domain-containing protein n=1 Tax=Pseudocercospora musae TaxID=113226 RepID=A0A139ICP8_9PEZI|nr:hypothetical protein AC579_1708 [Pseudocercospora musae]
MISSKPLDPLRKDSMLDSLAPNVPLSHQDPKPARITTTLGNGRDGLRALPPTLKKSPSPRMLKGLLERKCHTHVDSINSHDFFEGGAIWLDKWEKWEAEISFLSTQKMDLEQYVDAWKKITRCYPDMKLKVVQMQTDVRGEALAEVCFAVEVTGMPKGVVRRNVSLATFEVLDGRWLATRFRTLGG